MNWMNPGIKLQKKIRRKIRKFNFKKVKQYLKRINGSIDCWRVLVHLLRSLKNCFRKMANNKKIPIFNCQNRPFSEWKFNSDAIENHLVWSYFVMVQFISEFPTVPYSIRHTICFKAISTNDGFTKIRKFSLLKG